MATPPNTPVQPDGLTDDFTPSPEAVGRIWQHALHEETVYNDTSNFFLVAEAMFLVFYATLIADINLWGQIIIPVLGLVVTALWLVINVRQEADLQTAVSCLKDFCPEYVEFKRRREEKAFRKTARPILSWAVPTVVGLTWLVLLIQSTDELWANLLG